MPDHAGDLCKWILGTDLNNLEAVTTAFPKHDDHLNIDTFFKTGAYASLYKAYGDTVDERKADDITVSIVREGKPEGLFRYFADHGIGIGRPYPGVYYVLDKVLFPTQIIVTGELSDESHIWLKALSDKLGKEQMRKLFKHEKVGEATEKVRKETEEKVRKETEKRQAMNTAKIMISSGNFSAKQIAEYVPGISIEEVISLEKELFHA